MPPVPATFVPVEKTHDLVPELRTDVEKGKVWIEFFGQHEDAGTALAQLLDMVTESTVREVTKRIRAHAEHMRSIGYVDHHCDVWRNVAHWLEHTTLEPRPRPCGTCGKPGHRPQDHGGWDPRDEGHG